jgi:hypothetical protein
MATPGDRAFVEWGLIELELPSPPGDVVKPTRFEIDPKVSPGTNLEALWNQTLENVYRLRDFVGGDKVTIADTNCITACDWVIGFLENEWGIRLEG